MRYAQVKAGQRLHLVCEPGEEWKGRGVVRVGYIGLPICGRPVPESPYRMTINVPLANLCGNCRRVYEANSDG